MQYVYILKCCDNNLYIGCTNDLRDRMKRHQRGQVQATRCRLPAELIIYTAFSNKYIAYNYERYLKSGSGRAFVKKHFIDE